MAITAQLEKLKALGSLRELDRADWLRLGADHGPMAVATILVILIAALFASNVLRLLAPPPAPAMPEMAGVPPPAATVDIGAIIGARLFGAAEAPAGDPTTAPVTSMNLFLAGTIAGANPESGWAIVGENAMTARVIRAGSQLPGGAILKAVYPDRIVLDLGGRLESLMLPRLAGGTGGIAYPSSRQDPGGMTSAVRTAIDSQIGAANAGELIRPQPVFENGSLRGVRAYPGRNRTLFKKTGLMPGDLITAINGALIEEPQAAANALRNLGTEPVQITIERYGQAQQLSIDPAAIAADLSTGGEGVK